MRESESWMGGAQAWIEGTTVSERREGAFGEMLARLLAEAKRARSEEAAADLALDEFGSHHPREDGRQRTVSECVQEAMDALRGRIASLEAEAQALRTALRASALYSDDGEPLCCPICHPPTATNAADVPAIGAGSNKP